MNAEAFAARGKEGIAKELLVGFAPTEIFVRKLEGRFGHLGSFFADLWGGDIIGVKWNPQVYICMKYFLHQNLALTVILVYVTTYEAYIYKHPPGMVYQDFPSAFHTSNISSVGLQAQTGT